MKLRILSTNDISKAITMKEAIAVLSETFKSISDQKVNIPDRIMMEWQQQPQDNPLAVFMPAELTNLNQLGIKIATLVPTNQDRNLPLIHALMVLIDSDTGQPKALIEGGSLTAIKTGAATGVATDLLAKSCADSLAIIGCGIQARSQLAAVCSVRTIKNIYLYDRVQTRAGQFAKEIGENKKIAADITVTNNIKETLKDVDIVCTATTSKTPIVEISDLKPGAHINAIGSHTAQCREVSQEIINNSFVIVEQRAATLRESCEKKFKELGELIKNPELKNLYNKNFTLFASVGNAALDIGIAEAILANAEAQKIGSIVNM